MIVDSTGLITANYYGVYMDKKGISQVQVKLLDC